MGDRQLVEGIKKEYPKGTRVELIFMDDSHAPAPGTKGKVVMVDDLGTIHILWENGSVLGAIPGVDSLKKLEA